MLMLCKKKIKVQTSSVFEIFISQKAVFFEDKIFVFRRHLFF
jgi:hypothetical protein